MFVIKPASDSRVEEEIREIYLRRNGVPEPTDLPSLVTETGLSIEADMGTVVLDRKTNERLEACLKNSMSNYDYAWKTVRTLEHDLGMEKEGEGRTARETRFDGAAA